MNKRLSGIDFIRCVSAVIIVFFHLNCTLNGQGIKTGFFYMHNNGEWGETAVTLFFVISGISLFLRYNKKLDIKEFYRKRWLSIYPLFYMVWLVCATYRYLMTQNLYWSGLGNYWECSSKRYYLLTVLGMDGYFMYHHNNFYIVGEWFLGAIILIYLLYPILRMLINKIPIVTTVVLFLIFMVNLYTSFFEISDMRNLLTCITSFWVGMLIEKYKMYKYKVLWVGGTILALIILIISVPVPKPFGSLILGYCLFFPLFGIGEMIGKIPMLYKAIAIIGKYTYAIFLVHHVIINNMVDILPTANYSMGEMVLFRTYLTIIIYMVAVGITYIMDNIIQKIRVLFVGTEKV